MAVRSTLVALLAAGAPLVAAHPSTLEKRANPSYYIFVTGDSFTSTHFNYSSPYPTVNNRFGNPVYPNGYIDDSTAAWISQLGQLYMPQGTVVFNGAVGGNTVNASFTNNTFPEFPGLRFIDMEDQDDGLIQLFQDKSITPSANAANTVFMNWFGVNDLFAIAFRNMTIQDPAIKQAIQTDIGYYYKQLDRQYNTLGIRKFVTILQPPLQYCPRFLSTGSLAAYNQRASTYTTYWNDQMNAQAKTFAQSHSGVIHTLWNPSNTWNNVVNNPQAYGAPNNTCYVFGSNGPHSCLWWDDLHPAQALNNETAKALANVLHNMNIG